MNETSQQPNDHQEADYDRLGYETAVHLFSLASQEFYSRFAAMLIVHGLLLAAVFRYPDEVTRCVAVIASIVGIVLSILWIFLATQSVACQKFYGKTAAKLEGKFQDRFRIFSQAGCQNYALLDNIVKESKSCLEKKAIKHGIDRYPYLIPAIFISIYSVMLAKICIT